ncbi:MAG: phosphatase [Micrococcales bacterium]|nr:MAG: phosphatase [Micrococcales bacterium]
MMQPPQLIVCDVDGTLLTSDFTVLPATRDALLRAHEAGTQIALASGRPPVGLQRVADRAGLPRDGMVLFGWNGSCLIDAMTGQTLWSKTIENDLYAELVNHARRFPVSPLVPHAAHVYTESPDAYMISVETGENGTEAVQVADITRIPVPVHKLMFSGPPEQLREVADELAAPFADRLEFAFSFSFCFEATALGVNKGTALLDHCGRSGMVERTVAFGDNQNDVDLLRVAGLGIAMGNAVGQAKEAADEVTADNNSNGIAQALERWFPA